MHDPTVVPPNCSVSPYLVMIIAGTIFAMWIVQPRSDGGGGVYFGPATSKGVELSLAKPSSGAQPGGAVCVLGGTGTGECRRVVNAQSKPNPAPTPGSATPLGKGSAAMLQPCASSSALQVVLPAASDNFSLTPANTSTGLELCVDCNPPGHAGGTSTGCGKNPYFEPLEFQLGDDWMRQFGTAAFEWKHGQLMLAKGGDKCVGATKPSPGTAIGMQSCSGASTWNYDYKTQKLRLNVESLSDAPPLCLGYGKVASGPVSQPATSSAHPIVMHMRECVPGITIAGGGFVNALDTRPSLHS